MALIFLFTVMFNVAVDPYQSMMPDITPERQRGRVMGIWTLLGVLGQAGILIVRIPVVAKFLLTAILIVVTAYLTCVFTRERSTLNDQQSGERHSKIAEFKQAFSGLGTLRQAGLGLAVFFLYGAGVGAVLPFLTTFVQKITNCSDQMAQNMAMVLMASTAVTAVPFGRVADRIGHKRTLIIGLFVIMAATINGLWITTIPQIAVVLIVAGIGNGAQSASVYPLLTELVPAEEVGLYTGLQTTMLSIAQPVTSLLTGQLINGGSYRLIFAVCAICMFLAIVILLRIDVAKAKIEIDHRRAVTGEPA